MVMKPLQRVSDNYGDELFTTLSVTFPSFHVPSHKRLAYGRNIIREVPWKGKQSQGQPVSKNIPDRGKARYINTLPATI